MNKFEKNLDNKELPVANLDILEPSGDKSWMITFNVKTEYEAEIYNIIISEILNREDLGGFHQLGNKNSPGFHGWEIWKKSKVDKEILNNLKDEIISRINERIIYETINPTKKFY